MRVFEHCEACPAPYGGGTVTRSMRRVANATLLRFDRYDEPPDSVLGVGTVGVGFLEWVLNIFYSNASLKHTHC